MKKLEKATFAGGCFWCMEESFRKFRGVANVVAGYSGGHKENPTYEEVCSGSTGHYESIQVTFDPSKISYEELLDFFWKQIDPTDYGGQFADRGPQYMTAIFYHTEEQKRMAEKSKSRLEKSGKFDRPIATRIIMFKNFFRAEKYHQEYSKKNAHSYYSYKKASGREDFLKRTWNSKEKLRKMLTPMQYNVTQEHGTEPAFDNAYWNNKREGIYVDIVSGEPLFSSSNKFDSGTGWPSFTKPLEPNNIVLKKDRGFRMNRVEVSSRNAGSHLGHVFDDGPKPTGKRFCINSAALRFIPKEDLESEGYGKYKKIFEKGKN